MTVPAAAVSRRQTAQCRTALLIRIRSSEGCVLCALSSDSASVRGQESVQTYTLRLQDCTGRCGWSAAGAARQSPCSSGQELAHFTDDITLVQHGPEFIALVVLIALLAEAALVSGDQSSALV